MPLLPSGNWRDKAVVDFSLYLITDRRQTMGRSLVSVVRQALDGGVRAVQLREKDLTGRELFILAEELRRITREYGARLLINDRLDIALAVDADGVHLGAASLPVSAARSMLGLGPHGLIGYSAHGMNEAAQAAADGADFVTFGPVFFTPSKAAYGEPLGVDLLHSASMALAIPVFALGGVKLENISEVMAAKAHGIALISAVIAAADPKLEAASLLQTIEQHAINP
ncbi:MAG: thiamine-phosphate diphosphorylase [Desulfuromonadales bacterium GWD2_54_10]|nr:MAG: thiamine-phosphate diphosphorylase [Desulfuromonadales bacterium GWD2_54_10]